MDKISKYGYDQSLIDEIKNNVRINKASYVCYDSEDYPDLLRNVYDPPYILYYYGDISVANAYPLLSVVGARKSTDYGKKGQQVPGQGPIRSWYRHSKWFGSRYRFPCPQVLYGGWVSYHSRDGDFYR